MLIQFLRGKNVSGMNILFYFSNKWYTYENNCKRYLDMFVVNKCKNFFLNLKFNINCYFFVRNLPSIKLVYIRIRTYIYLKLIQKQYNPF